MATKKKTPPLRLQVRCISDHAFTHSTFLKHVVFDDAGHLLCTDANGAWSVWRLHDGARLHHTPCHEANLTKPGPLRPFRPDAWLGWNGIDEHLAALDAETGAPTTLQLPSTTHRVGEHLVTLLPSTIELRDPETLTLRAVHPHGQNDATLVTAAGDFLVCAAAGRYWTMRLSTGEVHALGLSGGARVLAVRARDGLVIGRDEAPAALIVSTFDGQHARQTAFMQTAPNVAVCGVEDDTLVLCGDNDGHVRCMSLDDGLERWRVALEGSIHALALSPDGRTLAAAVGQRALLLDARTGELRGPCGPVWPPTALSFGGNPWTVCASPSRRQQLPVKYVHLLTPGDARGWRPIAGSLACAAGDHVVMLDENAQLTRTSLAEAPPALRVPGVLGLGTGALAVGSGGEVLRGRYEVRRSARVLELVRFDASGAQEVFELAADKKKHPALCAHSAGGLVVVGTEDKDVVVYSVAKGTRLHTLSGLKRPADRVVLSPDGRYVAAIEFKQVMCWPLDGGSPWTQKLDEGAGSVCFAADGRLVVVGTTEQLTLRPALLHAWQSADGVGRGVAMAPWSTSTPALATGPDGALYAAGGDLNVYRVDLPDGW